MKRRFYGLTLIFFCFLNLVPIFGEVTETFQPQNTPHQNSQKKKVVKIEYRIDELPVTNGEMLNNLKELTHITVGSQFSRYAIQQSVISLYSLQQFSQIEVYTVETSEGIVLTFDLTNMMHIEKINITGVLANDLSDAIRDVIRLEHGAMYVSMIAKSDAASIKTVCADNGYFGADVKIKTTPTDGILTYQITLGDPKVVSKFQIRGNTAIFTELIKEKCQSYVGKVYRKSAVDIDKTVIQELYRKRYYPSTKIVSTFVPETGVLTLNIDEGKQLLLDFVDENGEPIIQDSLSRKFLSILGINTGASERDVLRNNIASYINSETLWTQIVVAHFAAKGFDGAVVSWEKITNSPLHVKFTIIPGTQYVVKRVAFKGNDAFTEKELLREIDTKPLNPFSRLIWKRIFSQQTLDRDIQRLSILYQNAGYPDMEVKKPDLDKRTVKDRRTGEISILLTIVENHREVINRCQFNGNEVLDDATLLDALPSKPPEPNANLVQKKYENAILKAYQDQGYMDANIVSVQYWHKMEPAVFQVEGNFTESLDAGTLHPKLRGAFKKHNLPLERWNIQDVSGNARYTLEQGQEHLTVFEHGVLEFEIEEGTQRVFGKFFFVGDIGVKQHVLTREVANLQGTLYTPDKLRRSIQNLYSTGIFESGIRPERRIPTDDVLIRLQKRKPGSYGASVGYSSSDGPRGTIALSHLNLFKRNIRFRLRSRLGTLGYLYGTTLTEPWLIGRTSGSLQFLGRKLEEDDGVRALQGSFTLSRKLPRAHRLNLEYSYRYLTDTSETPSITKPSTTVSSLRFLWRQDSKISSLNPISGMLNEVTVEYAGGFLGGKNSFIKTTADTRYHRRLNQRGFVLATAVRLGFTTGIFADREAELISFERFWAGGSTTVRGYEDRGLGPEDSTKKHRGNVQFIFNTELSFPIYTPIDGVLFFDTGNVWGTIEDIEYEWLPSAVGVGLRLNLGPLKLGVDYASPLISITDVPTDSFYFRVGSTF